MVGNSHLIDPAMIPECRQTQAPSDELNPLSRRPPFRLKRQTLIPEPMSYRLLYHHESTKPVIPAPDNRPGNQHRQQHGEQGQGKHSQ